MTSAVKRQQLVNELRKAHFNLGYAENKDAQSEYIYQYKQKMLEKQKKKQGNPREHHYQLGSDDPAFLSEFKHRYLEHNNHEPIALSEEKKKDLRRQHFVLGYEDKLPQTTYSDEYYKKNVPHEANDQTSDVRKHMHDFGDTLTYYSSVYKEAFNKNIEGYKHPEKVPIDGNALRRTNMILGNQTPQYQTQNSTTYVNRSSSVAKPIKALDSGISLGNDRNGYMSSHKTDYGHKYNSATKVDKQTIRDFRSAHFKLGSPNMPNNYQSEHKGEYGQKSLDGNFKTGKPNDNVDLKMDCPIDYNSIYKGNYNGLPAQVTQPIIPTGQLNSLGSDSNSYQTEAKAKFTSHPLNPQASFKATGDKSNLEFGNGPTDYSTQYREVHRDRFDQLKKNELSKEEIENLKDKHFQHGYKGIIYDTTNSYYGKQQGPAGTLNQDQLRALKRPNIYDVDPDIKKNTIYKTSFHWKANKEY